MTKKNTNWSKTSILATTSKIVVFIDSNVDNYQALAQGIISEAEVIILQANQDGIKQITEVLKQKQISTIHLVSHGSPGCLYLGNSQLSLDTLNQYASDLKTWFSKSPLLIGDGQGERLLLYGCNVASGDAGEEFIAKLHKITNAEIAASSTRIGNLTLGGNWDLDYQTSEFNAKLAFNVATQQNYAGVLEEKDKNQIISDLAEELSQNLTKDLATVTTDKDDYPPGATAIITGENFELGETIELQVLHTDGIPNTGDGHKPWQITDGGQGDLDGVVDGNFETTWYVNPDDSANSAFELTATGLNSGEIATNDFTDSTIFSENFDPTTNTWTVNPNSTDNATTSATGRWDIGDPVGHSRFDSTAFEELEAYNGTNALVTGISGSSSEVARTSGSATDAVTTIKSSNFTLSNSPNFNTLDFRYYLSTNDTTSFTGTDSFKVELVKASDNTVLSTLLNAVHAQTSTNTTLTRTGAWGLASTSLDAYAGQSVYLRLTVTDANNNTTLEAGIDAVNVTSLDKSTLYTANEVFSLGNRIWNDADNDGSFDTGEAGINSVVVNLYKDSNNDGTPDGGIVATDTTSNGGYYRFDNLLADSYIVEVAASNFNTGNPLAGLISSSVDEADPDSNVDKNDNGVGTASSLTNGIRSATVTLGSSYIEPTGETELEPLSFSTVSVTAADAVASSPSIYVNAIDGLARGRVVEAGTYFDAFNVDVTGYGNDFTGFCIEFAEFVTAGTYTPVNATGPGPYYNSSYNDSSDISSFFGVDSNASNYGIVTQAELNLISTVWYNKQSTLKTNVNDAAAMQALIWELQNDQIFDLSSGNFYLDPNAGTNSTTLTNTNNTKTTVETWVNNFNTGTWTGSLPLAILTVEDTQDIIVNLDLGVGSTDSQSNLTADFGFTDQIDYGDAPDTSAGTGAGNYTTTSANGGPSHGIITGLSIGSTIDEDNGTLQNTGATADDTTNNGATDDEDGVTLSTLKTDNGSYSTTVSVTNTTGTTATLIGWIDFDQSGTFDSDEAATVTVASGGTSGVLNWSSIPSDTKAGTTYARFRLSTDAALTTSYSTGALTNGEVEDYQLTVTGVDYGDAPDSGAGTGTGNYETTNKTGTANDGASHTIVTGLSIGSTVDGDSGSLQNTGATADDTTNNGATDDEDGISSFDPLATNASTYSVDLDVTNTTGGNVTLIGWIDFDGNGSFDTDEEATIAVADNDTTAILTWNSIPGDITAGTTYGRFRISSDTLTEADSTGAATDGEVEDYQITIAQADYGDAPDTSASTGAGDYTTTKANSGASHTIVTGLSIGGTVDGDSGSLQNSDATADDVNGSDDEDGISSFDPLATNTSNYSVDVAVTNTTAGNATLIGWIDFDKDGLFETGEAATATVATSATSATLSWSGLSGLTAGETYARFRLSTDTSLTTSYSTGALSNGEVEDYQLNIKNSITGTGGSETLTNSTADIDDIFTGGAGQDTLTGNGGNDCFKFNRTSDGIDIVTDFNSGDKIDLSSLFDIGGELAGITNPLGSGYVETIIAGGGTLIQIDFDPGDILPNKNVVYLEGYTTTMTAADFIF